MLNSIDTIESIANSLLNNAEIKTLAQKLLSSIGEVETEIMESKYDKKIKMLEKEFELKLLRKQNERKSKK